MAILDSNGYPIQTVTKLVNASNRYDRGLPWTPDFAQDLDRLFTQNDFRSTMSQSRLVFSNFGIPRGAIFQKADGVVGRAWEPEFKGTDQAFGEAAKEWLRSWYGVCDVKGGLYDFKTNIWLDSAAVDRDGDVFIILTQTDTGYPQLQHIPAHRVGTRHESAKSGVLIHGRYTGNRIKNGVIENRNGSPVAYCVLGDDQDSDQYIDSQDIVHIADPSWHNQSRGIPSLSHAILELRKAKTSEEWELMAQMMVSSHALIEYSDTGGVDYDDPSVSLTGDVGDTDRLAVQTYSGGMVRHFKSNSGSKLESINHTRPGDMWESFQDRVDRKALAGIPWPIELVGKSDGINGTTIRNIQARARASVEGRQDVLRRPMKRVIAWAVAKAIKQGILPASDDWYRWDFTMPPKLSIDPRNDSKTQIDEYKLGAINMTTMLAEKGKTHSEHIRERCMEIVERKTIKEEVEATYGIEIDDRELQMLTPNEQSSASMAATETDENGETVETDGSNFETLKAKFDAYGVAVRAGAITPSIDDENRFREEGGLPPMSQAVQGAWAEDKGFRRPITLVSGSSAPPTAANTTTNQDDDSDE